jgi:hypothetical protein
MTESADTQRATLRKINDDVKQAVGKRVTLDLAPQALGGPRRTGRISGVLDAADGMVVTFAPDDRPGTEVTYHAHHILAVHPM